MSVETPLKKTLFEGPSSGNPSAAPLRVKRLVRREVATAGSRMNGVAENIHFLQQQSTGIDSYKDVDIPCWIGNQMSGGLNQFTRSVHNTHWHCSSVPNVASMLQTEELGGAK